MSILFLLPQEPSILLPNSNDQNCATPDVIEKWPLLRCVLTRDNNVVQVSYAKIVLGSRHSMILKCVVFLHFLGVMEILIGCEGSFCYVLPLTIGGVAPVR